MNVQVFRTENTSCDVPSVISLVNAVQYFFVAHNDIAAVVLPEHLIAEPLMQPKAVTAFVRTTIVSGHQPSSELNILLTGALLPISDNRPTFLDGDIAIISSHFWRAADEPATFRYARHILQLALSMIVKHTSVVRSCIAALQDDFDCLCYDCEQQLVALGYRDGIASLKDSFNILNQLRSGATLDVAHRKSDLLQGELKLADHYTRELQREQASLSKHKILVVLHFLSDLVPFVKALNLLGCGFSDIYLIAKPYPYARRDEVTHVLQSMGVNVKRSLRGLTVEECCEKVLTNLSTVGLPADYHLLIIEDGGYFAPLLHEPRFSHLLSRCIGVVEQTQKGINEDRKIHELAVPIISVAGSAFKKSYESPEIGRVAIQNISRFTPNVKLSGRHACVFGFGSVGQEIAFHLTNAFNMAVSVVDPDLAALLRARHKRSIVAEAQLKFEDLQFRSPALIVGTTGTNSITGPILRQLGADAILVSTSSDRVEIDIAALEQLAGERITQVVEGKTTYDIGTKDQPRQITLLAEGYPINFYGSESLPNDTIDPIMTLLLLCAVELTLKHDRKNQIDVDAVAEVVTKRHLIEEFLKFA
ncbi:MAG: adenosylhomocysteinase [Verrucomicrobiota bacterium]|jgi:S-adenosylhomocysteine hydrolase